MRTIDMYELNEALIAKGYKARYEMTGGNCGTIYLSDGENDFLAIGPSSYDSGEANDEELTWGITEEYAEATNSQDLIGSYSYFNEEAYGLPFTVENVAAAIDDWEI